MRPALYTIRPGPELSKRCVRGALLFSCSLHRVYLMGRIPGQSVLIAFLPTRLHNLLSPPHQFGGCPGQHKCYFRRGRLSRKLGGKKGGPSPRCTAYVTVLSCGITKKMPLNKSNKLCRPPITSLYVIAYSNPAIFFPRCCKHGCQCGPTLGSKAAGALTSRNCARVSKLVLILWHAGEGDLH